jgi:hypothetical protein
LSGAGVVSVVPQNEKSGGLSHGCRFLLSGSDS